MSDAQGWRPMQKPRRSASVGLAPGPFARFARMHTLSAAADGLVTVALAGSIFFSIEPNEARWRVALYLVLTIAPFAVVTPFIGPLIDRAQGGRRGMLLGTAFARALVALLMVSNIESIFLFPLAFVLLVTQKAYSVAKSAVVPNLVASEHKLVEANSKLALLSSLGSMAGGAVGVVFSFLGGPEWAAGLAVGVYTAAGLAATKLPRIVIAESPAQESELVELRGSGIILAATGMGVMRGVVGFLTFLLAFELRGGKDGVDVKPDGAAAGAATALVNDISIKGDPGAPAWHFGAVALAAGLGALVGARVAPELRRWVHEERILLGAFAATATAGLLATWFGGLGGAMLLSLAVAIAAGSGKLAFDSLVQRDAPDVNYGRSFAKFEARFQLSWALGAFVPVVLPLPERFGFFVVGGAAAFAAATYFLNTRHVPDGPAPSLVRHDVADPTAALEAHDDHTARFDAAADADTDAEVDLTTQYDPTTRFGAAGDDSVFDESGTPGDEPDRVADQTSAGADEAPAGDESAREPASGGYRPSSHGWGELPIQPTVTSIDGVEVDPNGEPHDVDARARRPGHPD